MAHVGLNKLAGKTQRVRLLIDQVIRGASLKKGDTCDLSEVEARRLKTIKRVEFVDDVAPEASTATVKATR